MKKWKNISFRLSSRLCPLCQAGKNDWTAVWVNVCVQTVQQTDTEMAGTACYSMFLFWVVNLTNSWLWIETSPCHWHPTYLPLTKYPNGPPRRRLPLNNQQQFSHSHNCLSSAPWHCSCHCHCQYFVYLPLRESGANVLLSVKVSWCGQT